MDAFLSQDWSGIVIALLIGAVGFGLFTLGRRIQRRFIKWGLVGVGGLILVVGVVLLFYKEVKTFLFHRETALAVGMPAALIFYGLLFLSGGVITASLQPVGGLLIFSLILNPAAVAYQLTYSLKRMFVLSAVFGVLSGWIGLLISYEADAPSGAVIVIVSAVIFALATIFSPKRRVKRLEEGLKGMT